MKLNDFLSKLELALNEPSYYVSGGWGKYNATTKKWGWDCVCLIKGILWGWVADTTKPRGGGAIYGSNGVPDIGTEQMINVCKNVSTDFSSIQVGEMVWLKGHVGIFVGNGEVIEATAGWNTWKVIKSQIDEKGNRTYNGKGGSQKWQKHGFLPYIDYGSQPSTKPTEYWTIGNYKVVVSKTLRTSTSLITNNRCKVKNIDKYTQTLLTSKKPNDIAMFKVGVTIPIHQIIKKDGRVWGRYYNTYIVLCNKDGSKQALKIE